jgi:hypothetical protein
MDKPRKQDENILLGVPTSLGPTGRFPAGKIDPNDDGELRCAMTVRDNRLLITFGIAVHTIGFDKTTLHEFISKLIEAAQDLT